VVAARHAWLSPLPPEGASAIAHNGAISFAAEMAAQQGVSATDLLCYGIVDRVVPEFQHAAAEPAALSRRIGTALANELTPVQQLPVQGWSQRRAGGYAWA